MPSRENWRGVDVREAYLVELLLFYGGVTAATTAKPVLGWKSTLLIPHVVVVNPTSILAKNNSEKAGGITAPTDARFTAVGRWKEACEPVCRVK
jgi:hypothetical protein